MPKSSRVRRPSPSNQLRIIGGDWRGRKLTFHAAPGLRPTPDRVRETLFNWLALVVPGARCLDLFAGSGALGFEAASRGAKQVIMVEKLAATARQLREQAALLQAEQVSVLEQDAATFLAGKPTPFDVVFLDPPFQQGLLQQTLAALGQGWLHVGSYLYLEAERQLPEAELQQWLPDGFALYRAKQAGDVGYHLARHV